VFYSRSSSGERVYREAFERLKDGRPEVLPLGTPVTQSNVAREAGRNPCALAKNRYPELILEIKQWIEGVADDAQLSKAQATLNARRRNLDLVTIQRDLALSMLVDADARMLQLVRELDRLRASSASSSNNGSMRGMAA
jgi:hypothetical protein